MTPEELELEKSKKDALENVKKAATDVAAEVAKKHQKEIDDKIEEIVKRFDSVTTKEAADALKEEFTKSVAELQARIKEVKSTIPDNTVEKSFNEVLAEVINENADKIKGFQKNSSPLSMTMKAVGDMSISANFTNPTPFIQQVNQGLIWNPYNRVWLADLLPQATSTANSVIYPKENGGEGAAAPWTTGDKSQMDFDLTTQSAFFKWIAGIVVVDREMLDDIPWLTSYLQQKMLISLKTAENNLILNGTSDTNPVTGLLAAATSYNGAYTGLADMIIDASFGQIPAGTHDFYQPTTTILNPRDIVKIGLQKAAGSGEYNLPAGSATFANGKLSIAGLDTVATTGITANTFLTLDRNATMFLRRMSPEIRMYEDFELAKANKVGFRIEERVSLAIFNNSAIVTGSLTSAE